MITEDQENSQYIVHTSPLSHILFVILHKEMIKTRGDFMFLHVLAGGADIAVTSTSSIADPRWFTLEPAGISILPQIVAM